MKSRDNPLLYPPFAIGEERGCSLSVGCPGSPFRLVNTPPDDFANPLSPPCSYWDTVPSEIRKLPEVRASRRLARHLMADVRRAFTEAQARAKPKR